MIIDGLRGQLRFACPSCWSPCSVEISDRRQTFRFEQEPYVHERLAQAVVRSNLYDEPNVCTGSAALRTAEFMDSVLNEYYAGRSDPYWQRPDTWKAGANPLAEKRT